MPDISADSGLQRPRLLCATIMLLFLRRAHGSMRRNTLAWGARRQVFF